LSCGTELDSVGVCSFWFFAVIAQAVELGVANAKIRAHVPVTAPSGVSLITSASEPPPN
jgi:hypothetical protein